MDKKSLRQRGKNLLSELDDDKRKIISEKLILNLTTSNLWKEAVTIGVTVSGGFEWNTIPIIEKGWQEGKTIVVPKCFPKNRELVFYRLESFDQLEESFFNLREPIPEKTVKVDKEKIELLVVPGLLYDERGYRIGFGGGYYDRFLADFPNETVSIFYSEQLINEVPNEEYDIPVRHLITENGFVARLRQN